MSLKLALTRLAYTQPTMRDHLLPILASASYDDYLERKKRDGEKPLNKTDWEARINGKGKEDKGKEDKGKEDKGKDQTSTKKWDRVKPEHKAKAKSLLSEILMKPGESRNLLRYHMSDLEEEPELKDLTDLRYVDDWAAAEKRIKSRTWENPGKTKKRMDALTQVKEKSEKRFNAYVDKLLDHVDQVVSKQETSPADYPDDKAEQDFLVDLVAKGAPQNSESALKKEDIKRVVRTLLFGTDK